jgi:DNA-binding MarR family transcriptional regulator
MRTLIEILLSMSIKNRQRTLPITAWDLGMLYCAQENMSMSDAAIFCGISKAVATNNTNKLIALGYITRNNDHQDRRVVVLDITEAGQEKLDALHGAFNRMNNDSNV